jgi:hypothetical protein
MVEEIRKAIRAVPFVPFTVAISDGRRLHIPTVDHVFLVPNGASLHIYPDNDNPVWVSTGHVTSIEPDRQQAVS